MSSNAVSLLSDVDAYMFDVFGTTVDWFTTVKREVARRGNGAIHKDQDAVDFACEWRQGYFTNMYVVWPLGISDLSLGALGLDILKPEARGVPGGGEGSLNTDLVHRQVLDGMLASPRWSHLGTVWDEPARNELVQVWHDLDVYEDAIPGLAELRKSGIVVALSNGNYRLLMDMAKNKQLPWDGILSTEFFGVYKPMKQAYISASYHLGVPPERVAMVAAHSWDLEGAARAGLKTIYVPRPAEDTQEIRENMRSKADGGSVDLVVNNFKELAAFAAEVRK